MHEKSILQGLLAALGIAQGLLLILHLGITPGEFEGPYEMLGTEFRFTWDGQCNANAISAEMLLHPEESIFN